MTLHLQSVLFGFALLAILTFLAVLLMLYAGQPVVRRLSYWLFSRRGFEKLGRPIRVRPGNTPYERWLSTAKSGIPVHECLYIDDVNTIALKPWEQMGEDVQGLYLRLADYQITDARLLEIPPMGATFACRHLFEMAAGTVKRAHRSTSDATVLMLSGEGCALLWPEGAWHKKIRVNWREGTLIAQPIFWYRQFLNPGTSCARNLTVSASSLVKNLGLRFLDQLEIDLPGIRRLWAAERKAQTINHADKPAAR